MQEKSNSANPLVSIITPVLNGNAYLGQAIQSVLGQTYGNIEYIIIDGGSTDGSLDTIKKYATRIKYWLSEPDCSMYAAINKGIRAASGSILAYLNSDDLYYPETVETVVDYFRKHPDTELVYGNCDFIGSNGELLYNYRYPKYKWQAYVCFNSSSLAQPATFWRNSVHQKIGYFNTLFKYAGDFDFYAKAGKCCRFLRINKTLARYRCHNATMSATLGKIIEDENGIVHKRYVHVNKLCQLFSKIWLYLRIKSLNLPLMFKKTYFYIKRVDFS
ncbi:MAG: glycosyltransferase family 2 protein [Candidatus Omnitrophica bacterium]|nr:glycosyltransferase family 2 protein [Candidatus Omnitrophota bacterium]